MDDIEQRAEEIVRSGLARAKLLERRAAGMRRLLADADFVRGRAEAQLAGERDRHQWEMPEDFTPDQRFGVWAGATADLATGEGLTRYWYATLARSEGEFRRAFARRVSRKLAHAAVLDEHLRSFVQQTWGSSSPAGPGCISLYLEHHVNYS